MAFGFEKGAVLLIDKEAGWTSFDVVKKVRNLIKKYYKLSKIKVGHGGTLDPLATGLIIICTGKSTKEITHIQEATKEYIATVELGKSTPSLDRETEVDTFYPAAHITEQHIRDTVSQFEGSLLQVPPAFSAKHLHGKRAYEFARKGETLELKPVRVWIDSIRILSYAHPYLKLLITCGKGTYIRSLARDFGKMLYSGAYLYALRRIRIGPYKVEQAYNIVQFENAVKQPDFYQS